MRSVRTRRSHTLNVIMCSEIIMRSVHIWLALRNPILQPSGRMGEKKLTLLSQ
jgi:hypothetical protein